MRPQENSGQRLRESPGLALDGKTLAERLYGGRAAPTPAAAAAQATEQRLDFRPPAESGAPQPPDALPAESGAPKVPQAPDAPPADSAALRPPLSVPRPLLYAELRVLGQVEGSFIVAEGEDGVYFIDQHAAHERVLYEQILAQAQGGGAESRMLALPQTMQLTVREHILLTESILNLREAGFILEHFGEDTYIIRGAPLWYAGQDAEGLLRSVLAGEGSERLRREEIFMAACKQAVKANRRLSAADISGLLAALDKCENSATCPHGRPIAIKITSAEIRKRFLR
jgi:DNA mismatch repair protein MutL